MDVISIKVDLVIEPFDGFTGERQLQGNVFARMDGGAYAIKKDGCLVFFNKPSGPHRITVGGSCYQPYEFDADFGGDLKTMIVALMPSRSYRFSSAATKIYGKTERRARVRFPYTPEQARILGEYKAGEIKISAFFSEKTPICPQRRYSIGKSAAEYSLKHLSGTEYELDRPLDTDADYESAIGVSYEIIPTERGEYFIAAGGSFKTAEFIIGERIVKLELLGADNKYDIKEI